MPELTALSYAAYAMAFILTFSGIMFGLMSAVERTYRKLAVRRIERPQHDLRSGRTELR